MRRITNISRIVLVITVMLGTFTLPRVTGYADTANAPSLIISHLKITSSNGQFVSLFNASNAALDMSKFQLEYFNSYDVSKATSSRIIALSGSLPPHSYFMISDGVTTVCYQTIVFAASLGFSSTAGLIELLTVSQSNPGGTVATSMQDYIGWSKTAATGAVTLPASTAAFLGRTPLDSSNNPAIATPGSGGWQAEQNDATNACNIVVVSTGKTLTQYQTLLPPNQPPIATLTSEDTVTVNNQNAGLMTPVINEILPNPAGTGNDTTAEFIELYNPNTTAFDLSGYTLNTGTTTQHHYTFTNGSTLAAQAFTAFYSSTTKLSLSNSGGQVSLANPGGDIVTSSALYGSALDGQAWAFANQKWQWTTSPTPGAANTIQTPIAKKSTKSAKVSSSANKSPASPKTAGTVLAANTTAKDVSSTPIHAWMLALVAVLAVLYGAYEFRADIANRVFQLRRYVTNRRFGRFQAKGR